MIGERIRLAREASKLTQRQLAHLSGVPLGTLGPIENGRVLNPPAIHIQKIAAATGFPPSFFRRGALPDIRNDFFRKLASGTAKDEKQVRAQSRLIIELLQSSEKKLRLPPVQIEPIQHSPTLEELEDIAANVRRQLGIGERDPIANFTRAVERAGIVVTRLPLEFPKHPSYSVWPDMWLGGRPLIVIGAGQPGDRERANIGHELGHLVLHTLRPKLNGKVAEREAWRFAGAILFPRTAAEKTLESPITLRVLMAAKRAFGTSIAFNARRAFDLGLISHEHFVSLNKQLGARKWRKNEPVEVVRENPLLLPKIVDRLAGTGSLTQRANRLHMHYFLFAALVGKSARSH